MANYTATVDPQSPELVAEPAALKTLIERLASVDRYGLDTEFHRERTYWPHLALVQVSWPHSVAGPAGVALIDPLAVDVAPFAEVLAGPATMVAHASEQDLEVLARACGTGPSRLFDTQVAAGFLGQGSASLASLALAYLGVKVAKGDRLTDWSRRPLTASQLAYAASDVVHLLELADAICAKLDRRGRRSWADEECENQRRRGREPADPRRAWWKLRDSRQLTGPARGIAQELSAWRERRARELDVPARMVIPDLALQSMASRAPMSLHELTEVRGLDGRYLRYGVGGEVLAAIEAGRRLVSSELLLPPGEEVPRNLRPAVALAAAWVGQVARDEQVDAALLATRADLVASLRDEAGGRLARGWRQEMVGLPLRRLVEGRAALAFAGDGRLVVEERSGRPLERRAGPAGPIAEPG